MCSLPKDPSNFGDFWKSYSILRSVMKIIIRDVFCNCVESFIRHRSTSLSWCERARASPAHNIGVLIMFHDSVCLVAVLYFAPLTHCSICFWSACDGVLYAVCDGLESDGISISAPILTWHKFRLPWKTRSKVCL